MGLCGASAPRPRRTAWGVATLVMLSAATTAGTARGPRWRHGALLHVRAAPARGHRETQAGAAAQGAIAAGGTASGARPAPCTITTPDRAGGSGGSPSLPGPTETPGGETLTTQGLPAPERYTPGGPREFPADWRREKRRSPSEGGYVLPPVGLTPGGGELFRSVCADGALDVSPPRPPGPEHIRLGTHACRAGVSAPPEFPRNAPSGAIDFTDTSVSEFGPRLR